MPKAPWDECVLDATMDCQDGMFCFCPIDGDINGEFTVLSGMMFIGDAPPQRMKLVAIVHEEGQEAVEKFCNQYRDEVDALAKLVINYSEWRESQAADQPANTGGADD